MPRATKPVRTGLTFEQYLELEHASPVKHEFMDSQMFMLAGTSDRHNRLAGRLYARLLNAEKGSCRTFFADMKMKVRTPAGVGYYPNILVTCDEEDNDAYVKQKPCLITEVLSPSTEAIDRGEKLHNYRTFKSLQAYVLVNQEVMRLEVYRREEDGTWRYEISEAGETITLPYLNVEIRVDDLYRGL